jgi:hypothetical protein
MVSHDERLEEEEFENKRITKIRTVVSSLLWVVTGPFLSLI